MTIFLERRSGVLQGPGSIDYPQQSDAIFPVMAGVLEDPF
jgi:hypothetical protein